jgi:bacillithiol biosynthesis cysteine-adding enzyme BshC
MSDVEVVSTALGGSSLTHLATVGEGRGTNWFATRPADEASWRTRLEAVRSEAAILAGTEKEWTIALAPAIGATGAAAGRLARVAGARGVIVTTGQQPGLFGGPIYTLSKALSALAFADALEEATGVPVCPVFWAATDDSDFAEASTTFVASGGGVTSISLPAPAIEGLSLRDVPLGDVRGQIERLRAGGGSSPNEEIWAAVVEAYGAAETIGTSYVKLLRLLLHPLGIPVLDAGHPAFRELADPVLRTALEHAPAIDDALRQRVAEIVAAGHRLQVELVAGLSTVFESSAEGSGARQRVPIDRARTVAQRARRGSLGANVLLRPVLERKILPTVCYIAGPGELAYFAQSGAVAEALDFPVPLAVPRWSGRILEPHVRRILERYDLLAEDLKDPHAAETRLIGARVPGDLREILDRWRDHEQSCARDAQAAIARLPENARPDPRVVEGTRRAIEHRLDRLDRRIRAAAKRSEGKLLADIATARASLFPLGKAQERVLNAMPFLARHGGVLLEKMSAQAATHARALVSAGRVADVRPQRDPQRPTATAAGE